MDDLISRQAAIDATWFEPSYTDPLNVLTEVRDRLKALPSAQPEPCEDTVSRQRLLSDLKELVAAWKKYPVMAEQIKGVEAAIGYVEAIPSAQSERKKGDWINRGRIIRCNKCKIGYATVKGMKNALTYNFCPNCGADMRGEQDEY